MKKIVIFLLAFSFFSACDNDKGKYTADDKKSDYREKDDYSDTDSQSNEKSRKDEGDGNNEFISNDDGWPEKDKSKFLSDCMTGFADNQSKGKQICSCVLEKLEKKYTSLSEGDAKGGEAEGKKMAMECLKDLNINTNADNNDGSDNDDGGDYSGGGWTSNQVKNFVVPCVKEAEKGGMEYLDAQSYCDCMQYKIAKMYSAGEADKLTEADLKTPSMKKLIKSCLSEH